MTYIKIPNREELIGKFSYFTGPHMVDYDVEAICNEIEQFYNAEIEKRDKRIAELEQPWIKCSERLPRNG